MAGVTAGAGMVGIGGEESDAHSGGGADREIWRCDGWGRGGGGQGAGEVGGEGESMLEEVEKSEEGDAF